MKFFLISDNIDTAVGMRLAGIEGVVVHTRGEVEAAMNRCLDSDVGIVLITAKSVALTPEFIAEHKRRGNPLLLEVPDRHGEGNPEELISAYLQSTIGLTG